ncbi:MAG: type II secretion system F family protein [Elusimicrobia bacterium]|nr:type II secretion system F family protein [Elusimicrobiota bacterium]
MQLTQFILLAVGFLGSMAVFTLVQRLLSPPAEEPTSLARIAGKAQGDVSAFESLSPHGSLMERIDFFLVHQARLGARLETMHMLLGKPEKPNPLQILHMKEIAAAATAGVLYYLTNSWALGFGALLIAFFLPDMYFRGKISDRQREIIKSFPSLVDLAALTIESGLDYMTAFDRIIQSVQRKSELEHEMEKTINEVSLGYSRRDALRRLAMRTGLQDVRSFVGLIIQSDELGTSLVDLLRNFSSDLRFRRLNAAEKAAAQAATKMLIPIFFFIFPTVFILMLSPMVLSIFKKGGMGF